MKFGILLGGHFLPGDSPRQRMEEALDQVRLARELGFDSTFMVHHFLPDDYQYLQPIPFLARIAAESGSMQLGTSVLLTTMFPAVGLAEELATLDVITGGRLVLGAGMGYREIEFKNFGLDMKKRVSRFEEGIEVMKRLWTGEEVNFPGRHFQIEQARLQLLPLQRPGIPIWIGAYDDRGIIRAARMADEWIIPPNLSLDSAVQKRATYLQALQDLGLSPDREFPLLREACIAADRETAIAAARPALTKKYGTYASWGHGMDSVDQMMENLFIVGDADRAIERAQQQIDALSTRHLIFRVQWPGLEQEAALQTIRLLGERVIPALRAP